ncbi:MAG: iron ABC transporter permease [Pirellulales bacterium]|nr:iron ABC transporter permease [Pirellulales bacterium]
MIRYHVLTWLAGFGGILLVLFILSLDLRIRGLLVNTLYLALGTVALSLPVGTFLAILMVRTHFPGRRLAVSLLAGMLFIPLFAVTVAWEAGFGGSGWWTQLASHSLSEGIREPWLSGWRGAIIVHGLAAVPWVTLIVGVGLRAVESELEEDALLDAHAVRVLWKVTIRRALPSIFMAALWIAVTTSGEMTVTDLFRIRTFAEEVYVQAAVAPIEIDNRPLVEGQAGLLAGCGLCAVLFVAALAVCRRWIVDIQFALARPSRRLHLGKKFLPLGVLAGFVLVLLIGLPICNLITKAGLGVQQTAGGPVPAWSAIQAFKRIVASPVEHRREITASIQVGIAASCAATVISIWLVWHARAGGWRFIWMISITAVCLITPGPLLGLATIWILNRPPDSIFAWVAWLNDQTWLAPWLVQTIRVLPLSILLLWPALASVPQTTLDAATIEGTRRLQRLLLIALPQRTGACALSLVVCFAAALGELAATVLVYPPGTTPVSVQIFNMLHYGVDDRLAALVLFLFLSTLVTSYAAIRVSPTRANQKDG